MNPSRSPEEILKTTVPLLLVALALTGGIIALPYLNKTNLDDRSRASEPRKVVTPVTVPPSTRTPEIICTALYEPVCGSDGKTYPNSCEANLAKISQFTLGECAPITKQQPITLPASN